MQRRISFVLIFFLIISILIFLNSKISLVNNISGLVQDAFSKPLEYSYRLKTNLTNPSLYYDQENAKLRNENKRLSGEVVDYENLKKENNALKDQFQNGEIKSNNLLPVKVIGFSGRFEMPDSLIIDSGTQDGVNEGFAVIFENNLVGIIKMSSKSFSKVILPTNKDFSILAKSVSGNAVGILKGEYDFILFDKVEITDNLEKNNISFKCFNYGLFM